MRRAATSFVLSFLACGNCTAAATVSVQAIPTLDVPRYMGQWYEIAKFPNRFQKKCVADTVAQYTLLTSGRVRVTNRCRMANGEMDEAIGMARQVGAKNSPKLKVRFAPEWLSFLDAVWGNYWVLDIDPAYQLVAVGEPSREYLWVLSRTPTVPAPEYQALLRRLEAQGFDVRKLERSPQSQRPESQPGNTQGSPQSR